MGFEVRPKFNINFRYDESKTLGIGRLFPQLPDFSRYYLILSEIYLRSILHVEVFTLQHTTNIMAKQGQSCSAENCQILVEIPKFIPKV